MTKRISIVSMTVFFIFTLLILSFSQENLTITTYYPSPYGSYNELQLFPHNPPGPCVAARRGTIYYDSVDSQIKVCDGASYVSIGGGGGGGACTLQNPPSSTPIPPILQVTCPGTSKLIAGGGSCGGNAITESRPLMPFSEGWQLTCVVFPASVMTIWAWCCD